MLKNCVFKVSVDTKEWFKKAGIRAVKTFAQTFVSMVAVGSAFSDVDWKYVLSVSGVALVLSVATSIAGIPEVETTETKEIENKEE